MLVVASYVVAENAVRLRAGGFVFFRDAARISPAGSLFVLTETSHHMWPELLRAACEGFMEDPAYRQTAAACCGGGLGSGKCGCACGLGVCVCGGGCHALGVGGGGDRGIVL